MTLSTLSVSLSGHNYPKPVINDREAGAGDESETMFVFVSNLGILIFTDLAMSERVYCRFVFKKTVFSCELG